VSPRNARSTACSHASSHAIEETTSGIRSPSRSTITGTEIAWRQSGASVALVTLHSSVVANAPNTGVDSHVIGSNCRRQRPSVGSQN
jgi:hypothetical protein